MNKKEYALETMEEGVLILGGDGHIQYANPKAQKIFEITDDTHALFQSIAADAEGKNDALIDLVIEAITSGQPQEGQRIRFTNKKGRVYALLLSCSRMADKEFVFTISDQTRLADEIRRRYDSTTVLTVFFLIACLWAVGIALWLQTGEVIPVGWLTIIMEVLGFAAMAVLLHTTSLKVKDFGLSLRNIGATMKRTAIRLAVLLAVFSVVKLVMLKVTPGYFKEAYPFWDWKQADFRLIKYLVTAFVQEFLARGGVQSALCRVFDTPRGKNAGILLTSLYFMALHIQHGLPMIIGSGVLSIILGYMYKHDDNIYGVTLVHYCFGKFADFLHLL